MVAVRELASFAERKGFFLFGPSLERLLTYSEIRSLIATRKAYSFFKNSRAKLYMYRI